MLRGLSKSAGTCGKPKLAGTKAKLRITCGECDLLNGMPATRAELKTLANTPELIVPGDTKIFDEPFDFSGAEAGAGYWREYSISVDSGSLKAVLEGEQGGQGFANSIPFYLEGMNEVVFEELDALVAHSGCMVASIELKDGTAIVIGSDEIGVIVESAEFDSGVKNGDKKGGQMVLKATDGFAPMVYDAATHGFDITPN